MKILIFLTLISVGFAQQSKEIRGIYLTSSSKNITAKDKKPITGVKLFEFNPPGNDAQFIELMNTYIGKTISKEILLNLKSTILKYYSARGDLFVQVDIPKQNFDKGVIQVLVQKLKYGKSVFKGENFYSDAQLSRYLEVDSKNSIASDVLQTNLSWLNRNPFQSTTMKLVPDPEKGVINVEYLSKSRRQFRYFERMSNAGSLTTGYGRFSTGFSWGNAFWIGDILSFQWTCSNEFKALQNYTLSYNSFLPWKHILSAMASYAAVKPINPNVKSTSIAAQFRPRYTIPIKPLFTQLQQSITIGYDYKFSNSNQLILPRSGAVEIRSAPSKNVRIINITQFYGNYTIYDKVGNHSLSFSLDYFTSPFSWLPHQSLEDFQKNRVNSRSIYYYFFATAADVITIPKKGQISLLARGQLASRTLPSTELMSIGGFDTVRGYHQSAYSSDNGFIGNLELRTLPVMINKKFKDSLVLLAFLDAGYGYNWFVPTAKPPKPQIPNDQWLAGIGPGLRYKIPPYVEIRADYGFKLIDIFVANPASAKGLSKKGAFHFGALLSY